MQKLITPEQMRGAEARYMEETGISSIDLMERAAGALADALIELYGADKTLYFACGPGGNGGDGYAAARLYAKAGGIAVAIEAAPAFTPDARRNRTRAEESEVTVTDDWRVLPEPDAWVDALFGIGLKRAITGEAAEIIERMNADSADIISVDIPSGLDALTGKAGAACVCADMTVTFQRAKTGHYLGDGLDMCGDIIVRDIGIPDALIPDDCALLLNYSDVKPEPRLRNVHKNDFGHLLIIAGSRGMAGAAAICALAAMRSGTGLTTVACPESIVPIIQTLAPCAICLPLAEENGAVSESAVDAIKTALTGKNAVAIGCGLSQNCAPGAIRAALESGLKCVVDADALNLISADSSLKKLLNANHVVTPHPGEAKRLLGHDITNPIADAREISALGCVALLKGAASVISGERTYISASGCAGMAKGGSGDALTGLTGALLAQGYSPERAAYCAGELHGLAGEAAQEEFGERGMLATDLIEMLTEVLV